MPSKCDKRCKGCPAFPKCATLIRREVAAAGGHCARCYNATRAPLAQARTPAEAVAGDREKRHAATQIADLKRRYEEAQRTIDRLEHEVGAIETLNGTLDTFEITPREGHKTSEATVVLVASDWHVEERVGKEVGGLNTYTLDIAKERATRFFQSGLRLIKLLQQDVKIHTAVLALLGDFISNDIHDEFPEINQLLPNQALAFAQGLIVSGIQFLLANSTLDLVIPCHSGNHARTTKTTRWTAETGHSLEFLMYQALVGYFRHEPRVRFVVSESMHSYLQIYDTTIRFHHGHALKYAGGVGGIYIPVNKAVAQWNKGRHADLDVFGHFHQLRDGGNFICNGSLIGYNAFAMAIKADFEKPRQVLFLIDKRRGRTCTWPVLV